MCTWRQFPLHPDIIRLRVSCLGTFLMWPAEHTFDMRWIKLLFSASQFIIYGPNYLWLNDGCDGKLASGGWWTSSKITLLSETCSFLRLYHNYPRNMKHQQWNCLFISFCEFPEFWHFNTGSHMDVWFCETFFPFPPWFLEKQSIPTTRCTTLFHLTESNSLDV